MTLTLKITNKDPKALSRLKQRLDIALWRWGNAKKFPILGTQWSFKPARRTK